MGLRHIVLLKWKAEAPPEARAVVVDRLRALPEHIPQIRSYTVEENIGADSKNYDLAVVGEFDDVASYETYRDHPTHQAVIREAVLSILEARAAIQVPWSAAGS